MEFVNGKDDIPIYEMENKFHVPNHQPNIPCAIFSRSYRKDNFQEKGKSSSNIYINGPCSILPSGNLT